MSETVWQLVSRLCPDGVEYRKLGEVCESLKKDTLKKEELIADGQYSVINSGRDLYGHYDKYNNEGDAITIAARGEYAGYINYFAERFWAGGLCYPYRAKDNRVCLTKWIYYYLKYLEQRIMNTLVARGGIPALNKTDVDKIEIPVPPLDVQREVVRILDEFSEATATLVQLLGEELVARRKQYAYWRDCLLTFDARGARLPPAIARMVARACPSGVPYRKLGEIGTVSRGGNLQKKDFTETGFPCIHYGQIYTRYGLFADRTFSFVSDECAKKQRKAVKNDIIMAVTSENLEDVCKCVVWLGDEEIAVSGHTAIIHHNQDAKYLAYYFNTAAFFDQKRKIAHGTKVIEVTPDRLLDILIPLPPLEVQREVALILDEFSTLTTSLTAGLPAEIAARQKQYEYYRDKLLSFKHKG